MRRLLSIVVRIIRAHQQLPLIICLVKARRATNKEFVASYVPAFIACQFIKNLLVLPI